MSPITLCLALVLWPALAGEPKPAPDAPEPTPRSWFDPWSDFDAWRAQTTKDLDAGKSLPRRWFDKLFNERFFDRSEDPFALVEEFDRRFEATLNEQQRELFGKSWRGWHEERLGLGAVKERIETGPKEVAVSFEIPGLDARSLELSVGGKRLKLSYEARGRRHEKLAPIPAVADPDRYRVEKDGRAVRVVFSRRP